MTDRQEQILKTIIEYVIDTAEPVGSNFLAENSQFGVSGATLRNEMRVLEDGGYLTHPHTSAGRVPTEMGYKYYRDRLMVDMVVDRSTESELTGLLEAQSNRVSQVKLAAKYLAEYAGLVVIATPSVGAIYYTGLSNLFRQPEMQIVAKLMDVSAMFDQCEDRIGPLIDILEMGTVSIHIGENNPLGSGLGLVATKLSLGETLSIIGPVRMNYPRAKSIMICLSKII